MDHTFETANPPDLAVEIGSGDVEITAGETNGRTLVTVTGKGAEETTVEQHGNTISITGPRSRHGFSFSFGSSLLRVRISTPTGSGLSTKLGSAELTARGLLGPCDLRSGSGDTVLEGTGPLEVTAGSGDLQVSTIGGDASVRSGSGCIRIRHAAGDVHTVTGSGDVLIGGVSGQLTAKSGSGDIRVESAGSGAEITTASGDIRLDRLEVGRVQARTASGDVEVGVAPGLPAWTDIHTVTGDVRSALASLGKPAEGAPFVELRLRSVSGDITVGHLPAEQTTRSADAPTEPPTFRPTGSPDPTRTF